VVSWTVDANANRTSLTWPETGALAYSTSYGYDAMNRLISDGRRTRSRDCRMSRWFGMYDDVINDPKVMRLSEAMRWHWVAFQRLRIWCSYSEFGSNRRRRS
jgi:hypothetical protein